MTTPKPVAPVLLKGPLILLGLLSAVTFGGPLAVFVTLRGGQRPEWPPDRPIEWAALALTLGLGLILTILCITTALRARGRR